MAKKEPEHELSAASVLDHYLVTREEWTDMLQVTNRSMKEWTPDQRQDYEKKLDAALNEYEQAQEMVNQMFAISKHLRKQKS